MSTNHPLLRKYPWAANHVKVQNSIDALDLKKKYNPQFTWDEADLKEEYIRRAGLMYKDIPAPLKPGEKPKRLNTQLSDMELMYKAKAAGLNTAGVEGRQDLLALANQADEMEAQAAAPKKAKKE